MRGAWGARIVVVCLVLGVVLLLREREEPLPLSPEQTRAKIIPFLLRNECRKA